MKNVSWFKSITLGMTAAFSLLSCTPPSSPSSSSSPPTSIAPPSFVADLSKVQLTLSASEGKGGVTQVQTGDTTVPTIVTTIPASKASAPGSTSITLYIDDALLIPSILGNVRVKMTSGGKVFYANGTISLYAYSGSNGGAILVFSSYEPYPSGATVELTLASGLKDKGGNPLASPFTLTFQASGTATSSYTDMGFETSSTASLTGSGDFAISTANSDLSPDTGSKFLGLSTENSFGVGAVNQQYSTVTLGPIPTSASTINLRWNFLSEEFNEYVGSKFDDSATISITGPLGSVSQTITSVNTLGNQALATTAFGLSGAYKSGWKDLSLPGLNVGSPFYITFTVSDVGDYSYASVLAIDTIQIH